MTHLPGMRRLGAEFARFGTVGALGFGVDTVLFNLLRTFGGLGPVPAKCGSVAAATLVAFAGNRQWTYRGDRHGRRAGRQFLLFCLVSGLGGTIQIVAVWISHDLLGFTSLLADNIAGGVVGMAVATVFRFWGYRTLVFTGDDRSLALPLPPTREGAPAPQFSQAD